MIEFLLSLSGEIILLQLIASISHTWSTKQQRTKRCCILTTQMCHLLEFMYNCKEKSYQHYNVPLHFLAILNIFAALVYNSAASSSFEALLH